MSTYPFEPELDQPTPRCVRMDGGGVLGLFRALSVIPVLFGVLFFVSAANETLVVLGYRVFGSALEGRVVGKDEVVGKRTGHFVEYAYTVDGREYQRREPVESGVYNSLAEAQPVRLVVVPWAPDAARLTPVGGAYPILALAIAWGLAAVVNTIMVGWLWQLFYLPWRQRRQVRDGVPTGGLVRGIQSGEGKGGRWYRVEYEYAPPEDGPGQVRTGSMTATGPAAAALKAGDVLTVLYDPRRPGRSLLYRLGDYKVLPADGPA